MTKFARSVAVCAGILKVCRLFRIAVKIFVLFVSLAALSACRAQQPETSGGASGNSRDTLLGLVGYNYTDRHISVYSVDGADGGHINLSSPTSGGSGVSCCVRLSKTNTGPIHVKVRWQVDGCIFLIKDDRTGKADKVRHFYYKESEVEVQPVVGEKPNYIETHFFPNGTVQVRLTEHGSDPLLALDEMRPDKSYFPKCEHDKNPEE
jgi:hypothetical protein